MLITARSNEQVHDRITSALTRLPSSGNVSNMSMSRAVLEAHSGDLFNIEHLLGSHSKHFTEVSLPSYIAAKGTSIGHSEIDAIVKLVEEGGWTASFLVEHALPEFVKCKSFDYSASSILQFGRCIISWINAKHYNTELIVGMLLPECIKAESNSFNLNDLSRLLDEIDRVVKLLAPDKLKQTVDLTKELLKTGHFSRPSVALVDIAGIALRLTSAVEITQPIQKELICFLNRFIINTELNNAPLELLKKCRNCIPELFAVTCQQSRYIAPAKLIESLLNLAEAFKGCRSVEPLFWTLAEVQRTQGNVINLICNDPISIEKLTRDDSIDVTKASLSPEVLRKFLLTYKEYASLENRISRSLGSELSSSFRLSVISRLLLWEFGHQDRNLLTGGLSFEAGPYISGDSAYASDASWLDIAEEAWRSLEAIQNSWLKVVNAIGYEILSKDGRPELLIKKEEIGEEIMSFVGLMNHYHIEYTFKLDLAPCKE